MLSGEVWPPQWPAYSRISTRMHFAFAEWRAWGQRSNNTGTFTNAGLIIENASGNSSITSNAGIGENLNGGASFNRASGTKRSAYGGARSTHG